LRASQLPGVERCRGQVLGADALFVLGRMKTHEGRVELRTEIARAREDAQLTLFADRAGREPHHAPSKQHQARRPCVTFDEIDVPLLQRNEQIDRSDRQPTRGEAH